MVLATIMPLSRMAMSLTRQGVGLGGAGLMTLGLLFIMTQLINNDFTQLNPEKSIVIPPFSPVIEDREPPVIDIEIPVIETQPPIKRDDYKYDQPLDGEELSLIIPPAPADPGDLTHNGGLPAGMPLVPVSVIYPESAIRRGLCGHVILRYDIGADGIPKNVAVVESSHRVFEKNAMLAIEKARYKPDSVGGKTKMIPNKYEKITFQLDKGC